MKSYKILIVSLITSIVISVLSVIVYQNMTNETIGYVRTGYVLSKYKKMIQANSTYEEERAKVQSNIDTLKMRYEKLLQYKNELKLKSKGSIENQLVVAGDDYTRYSTKAMEQLEQRRIQLTKEVIDELNSTLEEYGRKHGYKLILGSTDSGSLLYGQPDDDISEDVLKVLNAQ